MDSSDPRRAAARLLLFQKLHSLFLDASALRHSKPVVITSYGAYCGSTQQTLAQLRTMSGSRDGFTLVSPRGGRPAVILYDEAQTNLRRRNFTLAHELGHLYLGHTEDGPEQEAQANRFATELLMPSALLAELGRRAARPLTAGELTEVFALSRQAAAFRLSAGPPPADSLDGELLRRFASLLPSFDGPVINL